MQTLPLLESEAQLPTPEARLSSKEDRMERGHKTITLSHRHLTSTTSARWSMRASSVINCANSMYTWYNVMRMWFYICNIRPQTHNPRLGTSKISDKSQSRDIVENICWVLLKTLKIILNKEMLNLRGTQGDITTKC